MGTSANFRGIFFSLATSFSSQLLKRFVPVAWGCRMAYSTAAAHMFEPVFDSIATVTQVIVEFETYHRLGPCVSWHSILLLVLWACMTMWCLASLLATVFIVTLSSLLGSLLNCGPATATSGSTL